MQRLALLDEADAVVVWIVSEGADRIKNQPIYQTLDVAKQGRDIFLPDDRLAAAYGFSTVLSLPVALDGLVAQLVTALDGNPRS